mgnify:CR=1 FL=1
MPILRTLNIVDLVLSTIMREAGDRRDKAAEVRQKLMRAVSKGRASKLRRLLEKHRRRIAQHGLLKCGITPSGGSLLHLAASEPRTRTRQLRVIGVLMSSAGCSINATDVRGRTPLHVAAGAEAVRALLLAARTAQQQPRLDCRDDTGRSVADAVVALTATSGSETHDAERVGESCGSSEGGSSDDDAAGHASGHAGGACSGGGRSAAPTHVRGWRQPASSAPGVVDSEGRSSDAAWRERLAEEALLEAGDDPYGWGDEAGWAEASEDDGDWFGGVAAEMSRRRAEAFAAETRAREEAAAKAKASRRRWQEKSAWFEAEEMRAREARQRAAEAALAQVAQRESLQRSEDLRAARERYMAAWEALAPGAALTMATIPWPCRETPAVGVAIGAKEVAELVLPPGLDAAQRKRALQDEMRRWHPDKFTSRWAAKLPDDEREMVLERVKQCSQALNELLSAAE